LRVFFEALDDPALLVDQMLSCQKQLPQACTPHEQTDLERRIGY